MFQRLGRSGQVALWGKDVVQIVGISVIQILQNQRGTNFFIVFGKWGKLQDREISLFVSKHALTKGKKSRTLSHSRRVNSIQWTLPSVSEGASSAKKVCITFFLHTLDISPKFVANVHKKQSLTGICSDDKRGKHNSRPNKTSIEQLDGVRAHIESFKPVEI